MKGIRIQQAPRLLILLAAAILIAMSASAQVSGSVLIDGVYYVPSSTGSTASVCGNTTEDVVIKSRIQVDGKYYTVTEIGFYGFNQKTKSVSIPSSIKTIDARSLMDCPNLVSISSASSEYVVKDKVMYTKDYTKIIVACKDIQSIEIPETVTSVLYGLYDCANLTEIRLPNSVTLSRNAFYGCSSLTKFVIDDDNPHYSVKDGMLFNKDFTQLIAVPAGLADATIPSSVTVIGGDAFRTCTNIKHIVIPESVLTIEGAAFRESGLTEIVIPNTVQTLDGSAFYKCSEIETAHISDNIKKIESNAFEYCGKLHTIYIGKSVTNIGNGAFLYDFILSNIYSANPVPPTVTSDSFGEYSYSMVPRTATVYVPMESVEAYKAANVWKEFNIVGYNFNNILATGILLDKTSLTLTERQSEKLTATITPDDATDKKVLWESSNESVATVDEYGNVTAVTNGTATITATTTDGSDLSAECLVTVTVSTGVDEIATKDNTFAQVFTVDGVLIFSGKLSEWSGAVKGIYIVRTDGRTEKISVR